MEADYFARLLEAFARDPSLGIASGSAWEPEGGEWRQRFVTGGTVWGATRAYRWECLQAVLPLEERHGWDGIDQLKARARGWTTRTFTDLPFRHHRPKGVRDRSRWAHWVANGDTSYFMGYRLVVPAGPHRPPNPARARRRSGLLSATWRPRSGALPGWTMPRPAQSCATDQSLRNIFSRRREALGLDGPNAPRA